MTTPSRRTPRAVAAAGLGLVALTGAAISFAVPASAVPGFELDRLAGPDRYATAAAIARSTFTTSDVVLLANGQSDDPRTERNEDHFPDALAGSYVAGARTAPTLLTTETALPQATRDAIAALRANRVVILGGTAAVSASQEQELEDDGLTVERIAGQNRYSTAAAVARAPGRDAVGSVDGRRTAVVASGERFPDALVTGPLSYAGSLPLTITAPDRLSPETRSVLDELDIQHVLIPGGRSAVSQAVQDELEGDLGITVQRFAGATRTETATLVAEYALAELGFSDTHVDLALGLRFPDALSGGPHAGEQRSPILLTADVDVLGAPARGYLEAHDDTLVDGHVFGGPSAVSDRVEAEAEQAAQGDGPAPSPSPSPSGSPSPGTDRATVTVTNRVVEAGTAVTGAITGTGVSTAVANGCGLRSEPVEDRDSGTPGIQFSETIPSVQPVGDCLLSFTTTFGDGRTEIDSVTLTITAPSTVTTLPELDAVEVAGTRTDDNGTAATTDDFEQTQVRFTFDEPVIGKAPVPSSFVLVGFDPDDRFPGQRALVESGGDSVLVTFGRGDDPATSGVNEKRSVGETELADVSVAVVEAGAVRDNQQQENPIGDRPFGQSRTDPRFQAGRTEAPDLLTVTATATATAASFKFDEPVNGVLKPAGFHLVTTDNRDIQCSGATASGDTVRATCGTTTGVIARGYVESGSVSDATQVDERNQIDDVNDAEGNLNTLQAGPVDASGVTTAPDLESAEFRPGKDGANDAVLFVFDEPVFLGDPTRFVVYQEDTDEFTSETARVVSPTEILAEFEPEDGGLIGSDTPALTGAVGVSVLEGAVIEAGVENRRNQEDEIGVLNPATSTRTAGRTAGPDLVSVRIASGTSVVYAFDEGLSGTPVFERFFLHTATGTRLQCVVGSRSGDTVTCTGFRSGNSAASAETVASAVLGTVDDSAVLDDDGTAAEQNPEGAEVTTGGTGKPAS